MIVKVRFNIPSFFFLIILTVCELGCSQCADGTSTCTSCKQNFTQNANDNTKCIPLPSVTSAGTTCPDGSFSNGQQCSACSPSCSTCNGPSSNDCIVCATGQSLFNGSCVSTNADGVCEGSNGMIANNNKQECDSEIFPFLNMGSL